MNNTFSYLCIDFQYDFTEKDGVNHNKGNAINFIKNTLFDYFNKNEIKCSEIISDYRLPRGRGKNESCVPGTKGFVSYLPNELSKGKPWIKCMHNPIWTRKGIGCKNAKLGSIYQKPEQFNKWLNKNIESNKVILFGLTADCCVMQVASELYFRGYEVYVIYEATDPMNERLSYKEEIMYHSSLSIYAKTITFEQMKEMVGKEND